MAKQKNIITEFRNYPLRVEFPILLLTGNQCGFLMFQVPIFTFITVLKLVFVTKEKVH